MNHWLKIVSVVELDPQAMLTLRLPTLSKNIHYDVRWASSYIVMTVPYVWWLVIC